MLGHAEEWFYRGLGGINVDMSAQGPRQIVLRPQIVGKLSWVRTSYVSAFGPIESNWRRSASRIEYEFTIPANTSATAELNTPSLDSLRVNGSIPAKADGVTQATSSAGKAVLVLGSGRYTISVPMQQ